MTAVIERRGDLPSPSREQLETALDQSLDVKGFAHPHKARAVTTVPKTIDAIENGNDVLAALLLRAWGDLNHEARDNAADLVQAAGLRLSQPQDLWSPFPDWETPAAFQKLVLQLRAAMPGFAPVEAALMVCACAARYAPLDAIEVAATDDDVVDSTPSRALAPLWARVLDEARSLSPDAPEWDSVESFHVSLKNLADDKIRERETGVAALAAALATLRAVPTALLSFFGLVDAVSSWAERAVPRHLAADLARLVTSLTEHLRRAEPLLRPALSFAEKRRLDLHLAPIAEGIEQATTDLIRAFGSEAQPAGQTESSTTEPNFAVRVGALAEPPAESTRFEPDPPPAPAVPEIAEAVLPAATQLDLSHADETLPQHSATEALTVPQPTSNSPGASAVQPEADTAEAPPAPEAIAATDRAHSNVPAANEPASPPAPEMPPELRSYTEFRAANWVDPLGNCERVPWAAPEFLARLREETVEAVRRVDLLAAWILSRACEEHAAPPFIASADVRAVADILSNPKSPTSGSFPDRSSALRERLDPATAALRVRLFLEAVRPSRETPLPYDEARVLLDAAEYRDGSLRALVLSLLKLGSMGIDPVPRLASAVSKGNGTEMTPARIEKLRVEFHSEVRQLWSAVGGQVQRTHCREAWTRFIEEIAPTLRELFPPTKGGQSVWDVADMRRRIGAFVRIHEEIADPAGARLQDRQKMDKAARRIADLAMGVNEAAAALEQSAHHDSRELVPVDAVKSLLESRGLDEPDEELCRRMLAAIILGTPPEIPLGVTVGKLAEYPDLLGALTSVTVPVSAEDRSVVAGPEAVNDPLRAAAVLLTGPVAPVEGTSAIRGLQRHLGAPHRRWLGFRIGTGMGPLLPKTARLDDEVTLFEEIDRLRASWSVLDELASRAREQVRGIIREVSGLASEPQPDFEPQLALEWVRRVRQFCDDTRERLIEHLRSRARRTGRSSAEKALAEGRFGDALYLLQDSPRDHVAVALRETSWRSTAKARYPHPLEFIAREDGALFEKWRKGVTGQITASDRQLRGSFVEQMFDKTEGSWNQPKEHVIPCAELRRRLKPSCPTYIPQLARFQNLVIVTAPTKPSQPNFEHATAGVLEKRGHENLYVVLAPLLSAAGREATSKEFRRRGITGAVVDDLDLCRILNIGGRRPSALLALLEIVLEQQPWSTHFAPFTAHDGQHVLVETYVGRSVEAEQLAQTPTYSRLFSGRKLGKSALLKYVHDTRDGMKLPSGNTLRVLFVPAVGAETDVDIVGRFADELKRRFEFKVPGLVLDGNPGDALVTIASRFIETHSADSLLVIFDEADKFVEAQLEAYERDREGCLSFRMRTQVERFSDSASLPRIRFVFAGYRATSTSEGAWANWGDVLRLKPLTLEEGAELIAGPLARMGIDASSQASAIAHRCGCQPVVLLRFGELLLKHLEATRPPALREHVEVTAADVAAVFNEEAVRDEIRVVVRNNFQDSARARVVFSALMRVFGDHAPGEGIADADRLLLERLAEIDPDLGWLHPDSEARALELQRFLKDFAARELLSARRGEDGRPVYFLRFPHHLSIILPQDPEGAIRGDIAALRRRGSALSGEAPARALVASRELDIIRDAVCAPPDPHFRIKAAIVGTQWPEAACHRSGGFADRLGIPPDATFQSAKADRGLSRDRLAVVRAEPDAVQRLASKRDPRLPAPLFLGGADLLRWAVVEQWTTQEMLEIAALHRLSGAIVEWWFGKVRALSFEDIDWRERVLRTTSGIPILLREVERRLLQGTEGGVEISRALLTQALAEIEAAVPSVAQTLRSGEPEFRLSGREIEIIRMLAHVGVATEFRASEPAEDLTELWDDLYRGSLNLPAVDPTSREDRAAVAVLELLGIVPTGGSKPSDDFLKRLLVPARGDAIYGLAASLGE